MAIFQVTEVVTMIVVLSNIKKNPMIPTMNTMNLVDAKRKEKKNDVMRQPGEYGLWHDG